jgi:hypothetical protein
VTRYLLKYLTPREQRRLLNTSQGLPEMKHHLLFWKLTKDQCRIFYAQPSFRSQLETQVHDPSQQLSLRFISEGITDVSAFGNVHALDLHCCPGVTDVSALGSVHILTLEGCSAITDVSALGSVHTLTLHYCHGVTDVSVLGSVHILSLYNCNGITDVSALGRVHILSL